MSSGDKGFQAAAAIRASLSLETGRVDPFTIAGTLGIDVVAAPAGRDSAVEGIYIRRDGRGFIFINSSKGRRRQRLTCAHEIGHHVLSEASRDIQVVEGGRGLSDPSPPGERAAFHFASALLMDDEGVRRLGEQSTDARSFIADVTKRYDVSPTSAAIRLVELSLLDSQTATAFRHEMEDTPSWRAFMIEFDIGSNELGRDRTRIPGTFVNQATTLRQAGILSEARFTEMTNRQASLANG